MRHSLFIISGTILFLASSAFGQTDVKITKKSFRNDQPGFESAWSYVVTGDAFFKKGGPEYSAAYQNYLKASFYNSVNPELNYKTGVSALLSDNKEKALPFFQKVLEEKPDLTDDLMFFTGRALQFEGKYDEAGDKLEKYLNSEGKKDKKLVASAEKYLEECRSAKSLLTDTLRVEIKNIGTGINSNADEYAILLSPDSRSLYFTSRRQLSKQSNEFDDGWFDENIYVSTLVNNSWDMPVTAGEKLITKYCESPLYMSPSGGELYIYSGYENRGDIRKSVLKKGVWSKPAGTGFKINSGGTETSMTFSPGADEIWFVSDRGKKGFGGKDIWFIRREGEKKWSKPVNAGASFNSSLDEESLRFSENGDTLWYGSRGHAGIGGFDIFYSVRDSAGDWKPAVNAGYPVNTQWDDLFFLPPTSTDSSFYLVSNRPGSMGGMDIYTGRYIPEEPVIIPEPVPEPEPPPPPEPVKPDTVVVRDTVVVIKEVIKEPVPEPVQAVAPEPVIYLIGSVKDSETKEPVLARLEIVDISTDAVINTTASSDVDGSFRVRLPGKGTYMVDVRGTGFLSDMKSVTIADNFSGEAYNLDIELIKVKVGRKVVLNNILFETGKSVLTPGSGEELDRLYGILNENPLMRIEISGHTDKTGSEPLNFRLSENRARAVVDYLVKKGVDSGRLEYRGFGSLQPVADNATAEGRAKNRRVEFKILEF
ncbi:MAG: OmpA family protein [Bacteroidales bacterium]|nr:OmpA family protein [Bacteroidales bacterium]MBN2633882.1 OmpA family protein [Bacteroidales bacterium]